MYFSTKCLFHSIYEIPTCTVYSSVLCLFYILSMYKVEPDNLVCCLGYGLEERGSIPGRGRDFSLPHRSVQTGSGPTQPPIQWALATFPQSKALGA